MQNIFFIAIGGALGAVFRFGLSIILSIFHNHRFPWPTLVINVVGSFIIGMIYEHSTHNGITDNLEKLLIIGFLGAFTTFSTFSIQTVTMLIDLKVGLALLNILLSCVTCILACFLGIVTLRAIV